LHALNAKEEIIRRRKIKGLLLTSWNSGSIAGSAENILRIRKPNKYLS
jgi:hypothetical protein